MSAHTALDLVCLGVAVAAFIAAGFVLTALLKERRATNQLVEAMEKIHRDERRDLLNRIQRPDLIPPSPQRIQADREQAQKMATLRAELRSVGTVTHRPEAEE